MNLKKYLLNIPTYLLSLLFISCHFSESHHNRNTDKIEAEYIVNQLFDNLKTSEFQKTTTLFSEQFYKTTTKTELLNYLESTKTKVGILKNITLVDWSTVVTDNAKASNLYTFDYNAVFEQSKAIIKIALAKSKNGNIKIIGYGVFLKP
jgi:SAM-dependent MidA family methyltransferase